MSLLSHLYGFGFLAFIEVLFDIELREEDEEHDRMCSNEPTIGHREPAILDEEELDGMHEDTDELHHLYVGDVPLPPDVLLVLRSHGSHHVVGVHEEVNESVEEAEESGMASGHPSDTRPHAERHDPMMDDVQSGHV